MKQGLRVNHLGEPMKKKANYKNGLAPCPFCRNPEVRTVIGVGTGVRHNMVVCDVCGATVSFEDKPQYLAMAKAWNSR